MTVSINLPALLIIPRARFEAQTRFDEIDLAYRAAFTKARHSDASTSSQIHSACRLLNLERFSPSSHPKHPKFAACLCQDNSMALGMASRGTHAVVTGGAGFIGAHLVRRLVEEGVTVTVLERPGASLDNLAGLDVRVLPADISIPASLDPILEKCDVLFHLAANPRLWVRDRREFQRVNTLGTRNVLAAAKAARVSRVVYTSTESIIGPSRHGERGDEETPARADDMVGSYCLSKFLAEQAALEAASSGQDVVIVNPTVPVGPGDINRSPGSRLMVDFLNGRVPVCMDCRLNVVDVRDVAWGHILAWRRGVSGRRYILGNQSITVFELLKLAGEIYGRKPPRACVPYAIGLAFAYVSEFVADYMTGREPAATVTGVRLTRRMAHLDCSRAERELGFQTADIRYALLDAIVWYQQRGWVGRQLAQEAVA